MNFLHQFIPQPIFLQMPFFTIRWYGITMVLAMVVGIGLFYYLAKKKSFKSDDVFDLSFWLIIGGLIGARLYDVFIIDWNYYSHHLSSIYKIWEGGLAIHGAIIGGAIGLFVWSKIKKLSPWFLTDLLVAPLALGQAIGRWGNYFNQELFGQSTNLPWSIPIDAPNRPVQFAGDKYFQPTFLYESILDLILFFILFIIVRKNATRGVPTIIYLISYGVIRFALEFMRTDETPFIWGLRLAQWASLGLIVVSVVFWLILRHKNNKTL